MKKVIIALICSAVSASCVNEVAENICVMSEMTFSAVVENVEPSSKAMLGGTHADEYRKVLWEPGDVIVVMAQDNLNTAEFDYISDQSSEAGKFKGVIDVSSKYSAFYPSEAFVKADNEKMQFTLPSVQTYEEDNVSHQVLPMVAVSDGYNAFNFFNLCGILELNLTGERSVRSVIFEGYDESGIPMPVCGEASVKYSFADVPALSMSENSGCKLTLDCPETGIELKSDVAEPFHIALPPAVYSTFTATIEFTDGTFAKVIGTNPLTISRSERTKTAALDVDQIVDVEYIALDAEGTSNCYIVSESGFYSFSTVKGNSSTSVGTVASAEVLWESFGTDVEPSVGSLIKYASYSDGFINFKTADTFKEGNAVIAAKDASGNILWSWHIWLTDQPQEQVYFNNAGTMMDRNLGATSATPGDVGALGLLYQWGRKDPFLGSSSISSNTVAKSTISWPSVVLANSSCGTVSYVTANPTTFVTADPSSDEDWHYSSRDNTLWTTSDKTKSIYDPCPAGWRVPDGGSSGVWSKALGSSSDFTRTYNSSNQGMNFSGKFGSASTIWYPASGCRDYYDGGLIDVGNDGYYWSASPNSLYAYYLYFYYYGNVYPSDDYYRAYGLPVRCLQEGTGGEVEGEVVAVDLSVAATANSYIVSSDGTYKFSTVKGNSSTSVGTVASAEVLWESFGTDVEPSVGDLVRNVSYREGYITFRTASTFREGNAVIAAKDASGNILWSWHIWLTDQPQGQVYYNGAGTMMDRNLGATSATPGDVGALGLLYQWGRKDPFLVSSSISSSTTAQSTISWPSAVESNSGNGTIEYATAQPTTFITYNSSNYDWYYTGDSSTDNTHWTTSETAKSIYDPCPAGWRVPDGGSNGIWSKAGFDDTTYDNTNEGISFSISSPSTTWYPASGYRDYHDGGLNNVGGRGYYWSASPGSNRSDHAYGLVFSGNGNVYPSSYYPRAYGLSVRCLQEGTGGEVEGEVVAVDLSAAATANSYIVSSDGTYKFSTVKGNSSTSVGTVASAEVLWESFGTDVEPSVGDLVQNVSYKEGYIAFQTADTFKEGNAVIAAKDASGNILWSWHIWLTDQPQGQEYYNNAGIMMDRNLGATSATPGDVGALGLLYQWGRKDPFLGSSSISLSTIAKSTMSWPSPVSSNSSCGTIAYATAHPTTFISYNSDYNSDNYDWYYTGDSTTDNSRWTTSDKEKSIYDPCPAGWRVPDGGSSGVWSKALGSSEYFKDESLYNSSNEGMNFSGKFGSASTIWYPASGYLGYDDGLYDVGSYGVYWSASPSSLYAYRLNFSYHGYVLPSNYDYRALGYSVRCLQVIDEVAEP